MHKSPAKEDDDTLRPLASLISKSEKAQQKLTPKTWQHSMLCKNLKALHLAYALMKDEAAPATHDDLKAGLEAFASMIEMTGNTIAKFPLGTSQHTLQRNRLRALREAEARIMSELNEN